MLNYAEIILNYNEIEKVQQLVRNSDLNQQASCELHVCFHVSLMQNLPSDPQSTEENCSFPNQLKVHFISGNRMV